MVFGTVKTTTEDDVIEQFLDITEQTRTEQLCTARMNGPPVIVTTLSTYASAGEIKCNKGRAYTSITLLTLSTASAEGLLNAILRVQFPAVVKFALTAKITDEVMTEHADPSKPQTKTEHLCAPTIKLLPTTVIVLPE